MPREQRDDLNDIWGEELLSLEGENSSDFERQNAIGKPTNSVPAQEENDTTNEKMMELEPLLEALGERNLRSIDITHEECPCHCLAQTVWYPEHSNLCLVWDVEKNSVNRITRSSIEGDHLGSEYDVGVAMDRGKWDEISGVEDTNCGIDIRYRL